jgi:hypothetical protein
MASAVDICNTALSYLGDIANVSSISPPDQSAQARHCARFYPIALQEAQELHPWNFNSRRLPLAQISPLPAPNVVNQWDYVYALPVGGCLNVYKIVDVNAQDDWSIGVNVDQAQYWQPAPPFNTSYTRMPFVRETLFDGTEVIMTNQQDAMAYYTVLVTDTSKFTALFQMFLAYLLASKLAGPLIKGDEGRAISKDMLQTAMAVLGKATMTDANNRSVSQIQQSTPWIAMR